MLHLTEKEFTGKLGSFYAHIKSDQQLIEGYTSRILAEITLDSGKKTKVNLFLQLEEPPNKSKSGKWEYTAII